MPGTVGHGTTRARIQVVARLIMVLAMAVVGAGAVPAPEASAAGRGPGGATQEIVVTGRSGSPVAWLQAYQYRGGAWHLVVSVTARIGRNGLSAHKREGDGATPVGTFTIGTTFYGVSKTAPSTRYRYRHLVCGDWWDGNSAHRTYNQFIHLPCGAAGPGGGSEALWRVTTAYQHFALINYNVPAVAGRGSAIFLHDATGSGSTAGCVSVAPAALNTVLGWLDPAQHPVIRIGTAREVPAPQPLFRG
jgi:L,D-peptidoglycan transpeptidase YkuD (ErfK/YbiS/YcfS/YnhG family)